jgi:8-oxo-dGTP diphosphatase
VRPEPLLRAGHVAALHAFGRLPGPVRRLAVRAGTPSYTVGAVLALAHDGSYLLLCQRHRPDWSLPGGLLDRGEHPADGVRREVREELGLAVEVGEPATVVADPGLRRVDVVYRVDVDHRPPVRPGPEVGTVRWMRLGELGADDEPTLGVLRALERAQRPGAARGRLLP